MNTRNWLAVASADHVRRGLAGGFMQVCHGKAAPLRRIQPGDRVVYYSPSTAFGGKDKLQSLTAIGIVQPGTPYPFDMGNGFCPSRRNVGWLSGRQIAIAPLLDRLSFSAGQRNWGYALRFGLLAINEADVTLIAHSMGVALPAAEIRMPMLPGLE
ncbi:EVE domain-containing protein [Chitinimonas naiadis]